MVTRSDCHFKFKETERLGDSKSSRERNNDERVSLLYSAWSSVLNEPTSGGKEHLQKHGISGSSLPNAPHLENCKVKTQLYDRLDKHTGNHIYMIILISVKDMRFSRHGQLGRDLCRHSLWRHSMSRFKILGTRLYLRGLIHHGCVLNYFFSVLDSP